MVKLPRLLKRFIKQIPDGHEFFSGIYHGGDAEYVYIPSDDGHVFDGEFSFYLNLGGGRYRKAQGNFAMNKKVGDWTFVSRGSDTQKQIFAQFNDGYIEGNLRFRGEELAIGGSILKEFSLNVKDGMVVGEITGIFDGGEFIGFCDNQGYADGQWTLTTIEEEAESEYVKVEVWNHGLLEESYEKNKRREKKRECTPHFREKINYLLEEECKKLMGIVGRGTANPLIHINRKK